MMRSVLAVLSETVLAKRLLILVALVFVFGAAVTAETAVVAHAATSVAATPDPQPLTAAVMQTNNTGWGP